MDDHNGCWQDIRDDVLTLYADHLGQAIDQFYLSISTDSNTDSSIYSHRCAVSSIIHGYSALESVLNFIAYRTFSLESSCEFIPKEQRTVTANLCNRSWNDLGVIEKCNKIIETYGGIALQENLTAQLKELNILRNWIVHGNCCHSTILTTPSPEDNIVYTIIDEEPGKKLSELRKKFPLCHFNDPLAICYTDTRTALTVIIQALYCLAKSTKLKWSYTTYQPKICVCMISGDLECDFDAVLKTGIIIKEALEKTNENKE